MNGWLSALIYVIIVGIANIFWKLSAHFELYPAVYVSQGMMAGAFALLLFSRPGKFAIETFKHINTWLYGFFFFIGGVIAVAVLHYIDSYTSLLLGKISLIFTFFLSWVFIKKPKAVLLKFVCLALIAGGLVSMAMGLPKEIAGAGLLGAFALGLCNSLRSLTVQTHTPNNKTTKFAQEVRVTGIVMAVTGLTSFFILLALGLLNSYMMVEPHPSLPLAHQLFSVHSILIACGYGMLCFSSMRYLEFYSVKRIGSMGFLAITSFLPVSALFFEYIAHIMNWVPMRKQYFSMYELAAFVLVILGSLGIIYINRKGKQANKTKGRLGQQMERDRALAAHTLEYTGGSKPKAAKLLGVSKEILEVALHEKDPSRALPDKISQKIQDNFTKHVSFMDGLTGLMNKTHFLSLFKDILKRGDTGAVLYIDLNKFKPINDTYGHEAGDEVLKIIAERLKSAARRNSVVSRLGGDEFSILLTNINRERLEDIKQRIEEAIGSEIKLDNIEKSVNVGASIGIAVYPDEGTDADKLLDIADRQMYEIKRSRGR